MAKVKQKTILDFDSYYESINCESTSKTLLVNKMLIVSILSNVAQINNVKI